ncbi:hypothetical protein JNJ66_02245 [Candidatus Saccharibacteria bacterium]|nr:hypothetical protein [Candidatus Saccharibacteria bacterium]
MTTSYSAAPNDSRYIPFTQQSYCCVPTSIQMIMYRNGIPLIPAEELGHHLGLTVPPEEKELFYDVRTLDTPPSTAGYGTQIFRQEYEPNKIFAKLGIPLTFSLKLAAEFTDEASLLKELQEIEAADEDALLCFNHGVMRGEYQPNSGHVTVFDRVIDGKVRLVDASWKQPKWRLVEPSLLLDAIKQHGNKNSGGVWRFKHEKHE